MRGLCKKFKIFTAYVRNISMLMSSKRNPWPNGKSTFIHKMDWFIFYVAVAGCLSCLVAAFTGSPFVGGMLTGFNAVSMWMRFKSLLKEKFKVYLGKILDSSGRGEDPYEKAAIKFAVAWPLLDLNRKLYENIQYAAANLPVYLRTPDTVYMELSMWYNKFSKKEY